MKLVSREYKLMLDHRAFADRKAAVAALWEEVEGLAGTIPAIRTKGTLGDEVEQRTVVFLDTPDHSLRRHGLVLRKRRQGEEAEYTLKSRSEDRDVAAGADLRTLRGRGRGEAGGGHLPATPRPILIFPDGRAARSPRAGPTRRRGRWARRRPCPRSWARSVRRTALPAGDAAAGRQRDHRP